MWHAFGPKLHSNKLSVTNQSALVVPAMDSKMADFFSERILKSATGIVQMRNTQEHQPTQYTNKEEEMRSMGEGSPRASQN